MALTLLLLVGLYLIQYREQLLNKREEARRGEGEIR